MWQKKIASLFMSPLQSLPLWLLPRGSQTLDTWTEANELCEQNTLGATKNKHIFKYLSLYSINFDLGGL